jgi:pimeloyl-ACP methyl ester carboxylesterase
VVLMLGTAPHRGAPADEEVTMLASRIPTITVEHVDGAGHFVHEEQPDAVLASIARVLAVQFGLSTSSLVSDTAVAVPVLQDASAGGYR